MARMLPPVTCYAGGDYVLRPIGSPMEVVVHYAATSLPRHLLLCPDSVEDRRRCRQCPGSGGGGRSFLFHCWDYRSKRFAHCIISAASWTELSLKYGRFESLVPNGPDVIMQRVGLSFQFEIGSPYRDPWGRKQLPDWEGSARAMASKSIWLKYVRVDVERLWPLACTS